MCNGGKGYSGWDICVVEAVMVFAGVAVVMAILVLAVLLLVLLSLAIVLVALGDVG
jgi:hypothetical protein